MVNNIEKYSTDDLISLLETIERVTKLDRKAISLRAGRNKGYLSQVISRGHVPPKLMQTLKNEFKDELIAQLRGNIQSRTTLKGNLTIAKTTEEKYIALLEKQAIESESKLDMVLESLNKLASVVGRLEVANKEKISAETSLSEAGKKVAEIVKQKKEGK